MALADTQAVLDEIDELLDRASLDPYDVPDASDFEEEFADSSQTALLTSWIAAIERFTAPKSAYRTQAELVLKEKWATAHKLVALHGILMALRADYKAGYLRALEE